MGRRLRQGWLAMVALLLGGCVVQSLQPFYTAEIVAPSPVPDGQWQLLNDDGSPKGPQPWVFSPGKVLSYDEEGRPGTLQLHFFQVAGQTYVDAIADEPAMEPNGWWLMHLAAVHTASRVEVDGERLTITPMDYEWMERAITAGTLKLPYYRESNAEFFVFTATPSAWVAFLDAHGGDATLFAPKYALRFARVAVPPSGR